MDPYYLLDYDSQYPSRVLENLLGDHGERLLAEKNPAELRELSDEQFLELQDEIDVIALDESIRDKYWQIRLARNLAERFRRRDPEEVELIEQDIRDFYEELEPFFKDRVGMNVFMRVWTRDLGLCDYDSELYVDSKTCLNRLLHDSVYKTPAWQEAPWSDFKMELIKHFMGQIDEPRYSARVIINYAPQLIGQIRKDPFMLPYFVEEAAKMGRMDLIRESIDARPDLWARALIYSIRGDGTVFLPLLNEYLEDPEDPSLYPEVYSKEIPGVAERYEQILLLRDIFRGRSLTLMLVYELLVFGYPAPKRRIHPRLQRFPLDQLPPNVSDLFPEGQDDETSVTRVDLAWELMKRVYEALGLDETQMVRDKSVVLAYNNPIVLAGQVSIPDFWRGWLDSGTIGQLALGAARSGDINLASELMTLATDLARQGVDLPLREAEDADAKMNYFKSGGRTSNYSYGLGFHGFDIGDPKKNDLAAYAYGIGVSGVNELIWALLIPRETIDRIQKRAVKEGQDADTRLSDVINKFVDDMSTNRLTEDPDIATLVTNFYLLSLNSFDSRTVYPIIMGVTDTTRPLTEDIRELVFPTEAFALVRSRSSDDKVGTIDVDRLHRGITRAEVNLFREREELFRRLGASLEYLEAALGVGQGFSLADVQEGDNIQIIPLGLAAFDEAEAFENWYLRGGLSNGMKKNILEGAVIAGRGQELVLYIQNLPPDEQAMVLSEIVQTSIAEDRWDVLADLMALVLAAPKAGEVEGLLYQTIRQTVLRNDIVAFNVIVTAAREANLFPKIEQTLVPWVHSVIPIAGVIERSAVFQAPFQVAPLRYFYQRVLAGPQRGDVTLPFEDVPFIALPNEPVLRATKVNVRDLIQDPTAEERVEKLLRRVNLDEEGDLPS